ncbi:MAG: hypothetical protein A3J24_07745 [Deltaproteobacteria bacterium RIFCSPLOWO2_02_FULL_53_8]|nr:MAG: hypothetical protein A3J24_07745 [Deltaproteobacteria bacterium RIFCSPLOWO2_02_FULL_53_8]
MDAILQFDTAVFHFINGRLTAGWLDALMPFVTEKFNFSGAIIIAALSILIFGKRRDRIGLVILIAVVLSADFITHQLKGLIGRIRPCNALENVRFVMACTKSFALPSGHATNIFGAMVFLSFRYKRFTPIFIALAFLVAYSRVYVGVHYPLDVIAGAAIGTTVAIAWTWGEDRLTALYNKRRNAPKEIIDEE